MPQAMRKGQQDTPFQTCQQTPIIITNTTLENAARKRNNVGSNKYTRTAAATRSSIIYIYM